MGAPTSMRYDTVTLLTDYGSRDEFAGVLRSVIRSLAPSVAVIDLTHGIDRHDVRGGALALARSAQYLAPGVVVAVVDPGVGTRRRSIAVEVGDGASVLVGPDNGLLAPAVALVGGATAAVELTNPEFLLPAPGATFAGRDVFAPVAAHLCNGVPLADFGPAIDPASLTPLVVPITRFESGELEASVLWIDTYGNAQLNLDPAELVTFSEHVELRIGTARHLARRAGTYGDLGLGQVGLVIDSYGLVSITVDQGSAGETLGLCAGDPVTLVDSPDEPMSGGAMSAPVELRARTREDR